MRTYLTAKHRRMIERALERMDKEQLRVLAAKQLFGDVDGHRRLRGGTFLTALREVVTRLPKVWI